MIDKTITKVMREDNIKERKNHKSSGKLTASRLGWALQWQVLSIMGVEPEEPNDYSLRLFARGNDVEMRTVDALKRGLDIETQKRVEYKNTLSIVDVIYEGEPYEIKSTKASKFRNIGNAGDADEHHIWQACLPAIAMKSPRFHIVYIAADDLRIKVFTKETAQYANEVENIITEVSEAIKTGVVPEFEARCEWNKINTYSNYTRFKRLTSKEATQLARKESNASSIKS